MGTINGATLIGTSVWRLIIAVAAFTGWWLYGHEVDQLPFLTQSGNLLVALVYFGLAVYYPIATVQTGREPGEGRIRGAMTLLMMVVGCTYIGVMGGDASEPKDLLTHVVTPLLVFVDWSFVGRSQNRSRPWHPLLWLIIPAIWLIGYSMTGGYDWVRGSSPLYEFADPGDGSYPAVLAGLVVATIVGGYLLFGIAKLKGALASTGGPAAQGQGGMQGQAGMQGQGPGGMMPNPYGRPPGAPPQGQQPWPAPPGHQPMPQQQQQPYQQPGQPNQPYRQPGQPNQPYRQPQQQQPQQQQPQPQQQQPRPGPAGPHPQAPHPQAPYQQPQQPQAPYPPAPQQPANPSHPQQPGPQRPPDQPPPSPR